MGKRPKGSGRSGSRSCTDGIGAATARKAWMKNVDRTVAARKSEARRFAGAETGRPHEATARRNVGPRQHLFAVVTVGALLPGLGGVRKLAAASCQSGQCVCPAGASEPPSTWSSSAPAATSAGHGHPRPAPDEGEREDDDHVAPVRHRVAHGPRRWVETEGGCPMPRSGAGSEPVAQHDTRIAALSTLSFVALVCCGGQAAVRTTPDGGIGGSSSSGGTYGGDDAPACPGGYDGGPRPAPTAHRAQPGTCPATIVDLFCLGQDAGAGAACTTTADCVRDGSFTPYSRCLRGQCAADDCLADSDCPSGQACLCASQQYGDGCHHNQCVSGDCRVDSDCGPGMYCSPNPRACGIESSIHCHKPADACFEDADCNCTGGFTSTCAYSSQAGAWVCSQITCAG